MNRYQLINLLKEDEEAYSNLKLKCEMSIRGDISIDDANLSIQSIFENCFDLNVKYNTCDKIRYRIAEE